MALSAHAVISALCLLVYRSVTRACYRLEMQLFATVAGQAAEESDDHLAVGVRSSRLICRREARCAVYCANVCRMGVWHEGVCDEVVCDEERRLITRNETWRACALVVTI
eukprot:1262371-Pleurochrysis_carterae.AAC.1